MSRDVLWELLRRSRDHVALAVARNPQYDDGLLASINMALEAYDEKVDIVWSPSEEPNMWGNYEQHATAADYHGASAFHDCLVSVVPSFNRSNWTWRVQDAGTTDTEEEAKKIAIAKAMSLK